jgi:hypothetical protein
MDMILTSRTSSSLRSTMSRCSAALSSRSRKPKDSEIQIARTVRGWYPSIAEMSQGATRGSAWRQNTIRVRLHLPISRKARHTHQAPGCSIQVYIWQKKELQTQSLGEGVASKGPRRRISLRHSAPKEYREVLRATALYKVRSEGVLSMHYLSEFLLILTVAEWRRDHGYVTADEYEASIEDTPHSPAAQTPTNGVLDARPPQPTGHSRQQSVVAEPEEGDSDPEPPMTTGQAATHSDTRTSPQVGVPASLSSSPSSSHQAPAPQRVSPSVHQVTQTQAPIRATPACEPLSLSSETAASLAQHPVWSRKQVDSTSRSAPPQIGACRLHNALPWRADALCSYCAGVAPPS